jgi:hypothetical protein
MGVSMRLSHFSVKTRIYLGFGCLLVLAVSLAGFGVDRMLRIGTQITVLGAVTDNTSRAAEATFKLESIRRALHKFKPIATLQDTKIFRASLPTPPAC